MHFMPLSHGLTTTVCVCVCVCIHVGVGVADRLACIVSSVQIEALITTAQDFEHYIVSTLDSYRIT